MYQRKTKHFIEKLFAQLIDPRMFFTFQSLSQKGALLDTKLAEVDLYLNRLRSMGLGGPSSTELLLNNKPQHRNSMLTPGSGGGDQGGNFGSLPTAAINSSRFAHFICINPSKFCPRLKNNISGQREDIAGCHRNALLLCRFY